MWCAYLFNIIKTQGFHYRQFRYHNTQKAESNRISLNHTEHGTKSKCNHQIDSIE